MLHSVTISVKRMLKNPAFFYNECKITLRMPRSFIKNVKERKDRSGLLKKTGKERKDCSVLL